MSENLKRCKKLLKIELEDLIEDVGHLLMINKQKNENDQITDYVFKENRVTLRDEINAIKTFSRTIDKLNTENFESGQEIFDYLENKFARIVEEAGYGQGVLYFVKRKMDKIKTYLCITE